MHTTEELSDLLESEELSDQKRRTIELLIEAMNDWPEDVIFLEEFLEAVEKRTGGVIHLSNTEKVLKKITLPNEAWIGESLTSIKEIILLNDKLDLRQIIGALWNNK